jgi:Tfp pilus assembly protein PilV
MKKLAIATTVCCLLFSAMILAGQQQNTKQQNTKPQNTKQQSTTNKVQNTKAMQDAKQAKQYGGAKFDGAKVNTKTAVTAGPVTKQDANAIAAQQNKVHQKEQADLAKKYKLDKTNVPKP